MFKIKQSLDAVNYGAYFYKGDPFSMEAIVDRAAKFGYDAVDLWPHRPLCFSPRFKPGRRKELLRTQKTRASISPRLMHVQISCGPIMCWFPIWKKSYSMYVPAANLPGT